MGAQMRLYRLLFSVIRDMTPYLGVPEVRFTCTGNGAQGASNAGLPV
jgi:hypothetical protein